MASPPLSARSNVTLPFLPGYGMSDTKTSFRKSQSLAYGPGGPTDALKSTGSVIVCHGMELPKLDLSALQTLKDPFHRYNTSRTVTHEERETLRESARNTYRPAIPPAWLKHDRQVLRFFAYFQEPVHENPKENFRIRRCVIYFYLEDGTMMVSEPKVENSGMTQGSFVKRHRIPKPRELGGGYYSHEELSVGACIAIYSRVFRMVDCDDFTRDFYQRALGITLAEAEETPLDPFQAYELQASRQDVTLSFTASPRQRDIIESKEYSELAAGGSRRNAKLQQYLENDRKVLRFKCYWDDHTRYGTRMYFTLLYYLADDTVEMLEYMPRNSGRVPCPTFWRRSPLPKNPHVSPAPAMIEPEPILYKPEDFVVGKTVTVYNRAIMLYDCDEFTRDFYREYMNHEQASIEIKDPPVVHVKLNYPPHTGFGREEDSLASCLHLTPRPPRRNHKPPHMEAQATAPPAEATSTA